MSPEQDPLKDFLPSGFQLYPDVDLEDVIMASVRQEAEMQRKIHRFRQRGLMCLTVFLALVALALWFTRVGAAHPAYTSSLVSYGFVSLFLLVLFAQLEMWWRSNLIKS